MRTVQVFESPSVFLARRKDTRTPRNIQGVYYAHEDKAYLFVHEIEDEVSTFNQSVMDRSIKMVIQQKLVEYHEYAHHLQFISNGEHKSNEMIADRYACIRVRKEYPWATIPDEFDRSRGRLAWRQAMRKMRLAKAVKVVV